MDENVIDPCSAKRLPRELPTDPMRWAKAWLDEAVSKQVRRNPNTMAAITVNEEGQPSGRQVLCKDFVEDPGYLVFYTNYKSDKVRLEGRAVRSPADESDAYFASRDWGSQLGAWGSDQSAPLESRAALISQLSDEGWSSPSSEGDALVFTKAGRQLRIVLQELSGGTRIRYEY